MDSTTRTHLFAFIGMLALGSACSSSTSQGTSDGRDAAAGGTTASAGRSGSGGAGGNVSTGGAIGFGGAGSGGTPVGGAGSGGTPVGGAGSGGIKGSGGTPAGGAGGTIQYDAGGPDLSVDAGRDTGKAAVDLGNQDSPADLPMTLDTSPADLPGPTSLDACFAGLPARVGTQMVATKSSADGKVRIRVALDTEGRMGTSGTMPWGVLRLGVEINGVVTCIKDRANLKYKISHHNCSDTTTATAGETTYSMTAPDQEVASLTISGGSSAGPYILSDTTCTMSGSSVCHTGGPC